MTNLPRLASQFSGSCGISDHTQLIRTAIATTIKKLASPPSIQRHSRPLPLAKPKKVTHVPRAFDLLTVKEDLPPGRDPRVTSTMNQDQIVAAMLCDMGIKKVLNRDLDFSHDYDEAMINV